MKNLKQIEKEFDKEFDGEGFVDISEFLKKISNQIIDEMIGEEKQGFMFSSDGNEETYKKMGYNEKVQELKEYKKKFNK
ncbi:unnamed protein product [marine sediment metagenome]|uniref:EF-hand domain-containing protein n=1 Tax=marine sediment metagenome TaxID=412755 RepID=X0XNQ3_9ZZZZ